MARIVLADDGIRFDGRTPAERPLGGVESSVVNLVEELARRGHEVLVCNKCAGPIEHNGVHWAPIDRGGVAYANIPDGADLYIANRGDKLIPLMPGARRTVFWIHNPARYLMKWRYLSKLWRVRPAIVFIGTYHATTFPAWAPGGARVVIPYGISDVFRGRDARPEPPGPRAVFTSNPLRSLDWLLDVWAGRIAPRVEGAELHVFSGPATYGGVGDAKAAEMDRVLEKARGLAAAGIVVRAPLPKPELAEELRSARVMLYRGDLNETFCLAVGEAQALGVPAVVQRLGSVVERVIDGETGYVADGDEAFADAAVRLLTENALWSRCHGAALAKQGRWGWPEAAAAFEELIV